jgi:hypothetical protein
VSAQASRLRSALVGRSFGPPLFDYLLIGGGVTLIWVPLLFWTGWSYDDVGMSTVTVAILLANSTHFAASTVRLYTKPGAAESLPGLTMVFPLLSLAVLSFALLAPDVLGSNLYALYLTWSPYHYAAQAYGLALLYGYRSGVALDGRDKKLLRCVCLLPFFYSFFTSLGAGADWLLPIEVLSLPAAIAIREALSAGLPLLIFGTPFLLYAWVWRRRGTPLPLISLLVVVANGIWWVTLIPMQAFLWATIFHGVQYLAIVMIFHAKEQMALPSNRHSAAWHGAWFYAVSLLLAYALFHALPLAYVWAGFGRVESLLLVVAVINLHHFIVDGYIWRFSRGGSNRRIAEGLPATA